MHKLQTALMVIATFLISQLLAQPLPSPGNAFDVKNYGATGKRADNATKAIQSAVDACFAAGGGVVYVPPGDYTTGRIQLKDNVNLHLEAGATLLLSQDPADFPRRARTMIYADGAKNIAVTGRGTLDGLAQYDWTDARGADPEIQEEIGIARRAGLDMRRYYRKGRQTFMLLIDRSTDVRLEGVTILNSPLWNVRLNECDRVFIRGVHIYSDLEKGVNSDGIDVVASSNVLISDCIIVTADDSICLKTMGLGGGIAKPVENVTVTNCILSSSSTALVIGTETHSDIRHVVFSNLVIRNSNRGFGINVQDGGTVSDVLFTNITMDLGRRHWNWWGSAETFKFVLKKRTPESKLGAIRDVVIKNVISHSQGTSTITGHPDRRLENITISDLQMFMQSENAVDKRATHAIKIDGVKGCKLRDITVAWANEKTEPMWESALYLRDVDHFDINGFTGRQGLVPGLAPAIVLDNVAAGVIRNSRADEGCQTFLHIRGTNTKDVKLKSNELEQAKEPVSFERDALRKAVVVNAEK